MVGRNLNGYLNYLVQGLGVLRQQRTFVLQTQATEVRKTNPVLVGKVNFVARLLSVFHSNFGRFLLFLGKCEALVLIPQSAKGPQFVGRQEVS